MHLLTQPVPLWVVGFGAFVGSAVADLIAFVWRRARR